MIDEKILKKRRKTYHEKNAKRYRYRGRKMGEKNIVYTVTEKNGTFFTECSNPQPANFTVPFHLSSLRRR